MKRRDFLKAAFSLPVVQAIQALPLPVPAPEPVWGASIVTHPEVLEAQAIMNQWQSDMVDAMRYGFRAMKVWSDDQGDIKTKFISAEEFYAR